VAPCVIWPSSLSRDAEAVESVATGGVVIAFFGGGDRDVAGVVVRRVRFFYDHIIGNALRCLAARSAVVAGVAGGGPTDRVVRVLRNGICRIIGPSLVPCPAKA